MALTPMMWDHVQDIYKAMVDRAEEEDVHQGDEVADPETHKVYTGFLTSLFGELGKPAPYYTEIMSALKAMGCVDQMRRGGGSAPSKWIMVQPPTEEGFMAYLNNKAGKKPHGKLDGIEQQLRTALVRLDALEAWAQEAGPLLVQLSSKE